jgi:transcriptional regulator with XRE-family HTH domain
MLEYRWSYTDLGRALGISSNAAREWEQGNYFPPVSVRMLLTLWDKHPQMMLETLDVDVRTPAPLRTVFDADSPEPGKFF